MKKFYKHYSQVPESEWHWPSFSPREIASKSDGELVVDYAAMDMLQKLRNFLDKPLILTSAYRSPAHNKKVGGAKNSYHMQGVAFDVRMENHSPHEFEAAARKIGFTGFGYYPKSGFMHIDTGPVRSWGKPWPETATTWPEETKQQPETLAEDGKKKAAAGIAVSGGVAALTEHIPAASGLIGNLAPTAQIVALVIAAALIIYLLIKE
jgi:hypothetical protein